MYQFGSYHEIWNDIFVRKTIIFYSISLIFIIDFLENLREDSILIYLYIIIMDIYRYIFRLNLNLSDFCLLPQSFFSDFSPSFKKLILVVYTRYGGNRKPTMSVFCCPPYQGLTPIIRGRTARVPLPPPWYSLRERVLDKNKKWRFIEII